jgi:hypothetical protein
MSLKDCIKSAQQQGLFTVDEAQVLIQRYNELARMALSPPEVRQRIIAEMEAEALEKRRRALLMESKRSGLVTAIMSHRDRPTISQRLQGMTEGSLAPHKALWMLIEHFGEARFQDTFHKMMSILGQSQAELIKLLDEFRPGWITGEYRRWGAEQTARMENVVRELFGQSTGDLKAKQLAEAWTKVAEALRQRFNKAGGAIGKLKDWGLPQVHSAEALLKAGREQWKAFILPLLDRERMLSPLTGLRMTDADLNASLDHVFDSITTNGANTMQPSMQPVGRGALARQHADHRFLHFKDPDAWLAYQRAFGEGDPFASMIGHLSMMARDIAAMEIFGPNPQAMINYLKQVVIKAMGGQGRDDVRKALNTFDNMYAHYMGSANVPVSNFWANTVSSIRSGISAASLGSAALSALSDRGFDAVTRAFDGLPVHGAFTSFLRQFGPGMENHAARMGLIIDSQLHAMHRHARFIGSVSGNTIAGYVNDRMLAASGLQWMTQASKHGFGWDFQMVAADLSRFGWDEIPSQGRSEAAFRRTLERHGFDAATWDVIRQAQHYRPEGPDGVVGPPGAPGTGVVRPQEVFAHAHQVYLATMTPEAARAAAQDLADRYHSMILREMRYSTPESSLRSRSAMIGTNQPGTFQGEVLRSAGQFKGFGLGVLFLHGGRIFRELVGPNPARGAVYFGALLIVSTLLGAVSMQLKEIANGRDPRRMDLDKKGRKFWGAALLQGGGLGIYGDFLFSDVNRFGGSLSGTVAGPMVDKLDNIRRLTVGNFLEFAQGQDRTNFGRELSYFIRTNTPGSSLWFVRQAWERVLMDQLQYLMDPDAHTSFRRTMQRRRTDFGQDYWWRPGEVEPRRGPDLGAMFP